jgi:hypothetical protein
MAGIERSGPRGTLSSKGVAIDWQRVKSMLPGLNETFLNAGQLEPTAYGTNGDVLGVFAVYVFSGEPTRRVRESGSSPWVV